MNCVIQVIGTQTDVQGEESRLELVAVGRRYNKNGVEYIIYDETEISGLEGTTTLLKIYPAHIVLVRMGSVEQKQEFRPGHTSPGTYITPYGKFEMMIETSHLEVTLSKTDGEINIQYEVEIDGQWQSSNTLSIFVREEQYGR